MSPEAENIFEMPPHLFWGSCPFWAKLRMAGRQAVFFFFFRFCNWNRSVWELQGGDKANPIGSGSSLHSAGGSSSLCLTDCVSAGCLFVLGRLGWGTNASPGASQVGGDGTPELPGVALLPRRWLGLVWTAAPVCFLRGKLRLCNHWAFSSGGERRQDRREWWHRSTEA